MKKVKEVSIQKGEKVKHKFFLENIKQQQQRKNKENYVKRNKIFFQKNIK